MLLCEQDYRLSGISPLRGEVEIFVSEILQMILDLWIGKVILYLGFPELQAFIRRNPFKRYPNIRDNEPDFAGTQQFFYVPAVQFPKPRPILRTV